MGKILVQRRVSKCRRQTVSGISLHYGVVTTKGNLNNQMGSFIYRQGNFCNV